MSIEQERADHFANWRAARRAAIEDPGQFSLCEMIIRDLLSTIDVSNPIYAGLLGRYNTGLLGLLKEWQVIDNEYTRDKRLSKQFTGQSLKAEARIRFWNELYDDYYREFKTHSLITTTK